LSGDAGYALQKLELAILLLATGTGDIRSRLKIAYESELHIIQEEDFPEQLRPQWIWIKEKLTSVPPLRDDDGSITVGSLHRTVKRMRNSTGSKIAKRVIALRDELDGYFRDLARSHTSA
jgi:hypothetical protein